MNPILTILFLGAAQGLILAGVLLTMRRGNRTANRILAVILMLFSITMAIHTLAHSNVLSIPYHSDLVVILFLPFAPLIYFYVNALTGSPNQFRWGKKEFSHFLPFTVCTILFIPFYLQSLQAANSHPIQKVFLWLLILQVLIYMFMVIKKLRNHLRSIKDSFSSIEKINLNWLRFFITAVVVLWAAALFLEGYSKKSELWNYVWLFVSIFMYAIGYMGLKQPEIFSGTPHQPLEGNGLSKGKYERSTLTTEKAREYLEKLLQVMAEEKPFMESSLTLPGLAEKLSISVHELSQIINEQLKQNFFQFVNSYRVEEAKKLITNPGYDHLKIAAIGFEVGFNSTSAFNAAFKKHTKMTPSQFIKTGKLIS